MTFGSLRLPSKRLEFDCWFVRMFADTTLFGLCPRRTGQTFQGTNGMWTWNPPILKITWFIAAYQGYAGCDAVENSYFVSGMTRYMFLRGLTVMLYSVQDISKRQHTDIYDVIPRQPNIHSTRIVRSTTKKSLGSGRWELLIPASSHALGLQYWSAMHKRYDIAACCSNQLSSASNLANEGEF